MGLERSEKRHKEKLEMRIQIGFEQRLEGEDDQWRENGQAVVLKKVLCSKKKKLVAAVRDEVGESRRSTSLNNHQHDGCCLVRRKKGVLDAGRAAFYPQIEEGRGDGGRNALNQTPDSVPQGREGGFHEFGGGVMDEWKEYARKQQGAVAVVQVR